MVFLSVCNKFWLKSYLLKNCFWILKWFTIGVLNTKDDSHKFLDKVQLSVFGIHHITIYITHIGDSWIPSSSTTIHSQWPWNQATQPIISLISCSDWNLQGKTWYYSLCQQLQISAQTDFCTVCQSPLETDIWHMLWYYK